MFEIIFQMSQSNVDRIYAWQIFDLDKENYFFNR